MDIRKEIDSFAGEYYKIETDSKSSRFDLAVVPIEDMEAFCCSYRAEPFFMSAAAGTQVSEIPKETQWLGVKHSDGTYSVYFSLVCGKFRTSLYGADDRLRVVALTGDEELQEDGFYAFYKISGGNFYSLVECAAASISERFHTVRLRSEKREPEFMKYFGWCTWDSFYADVTQDDVSRGLRNWKEGGFVPKLLILDDGWQTVNNYTEPQGHRKLSDFKANEKFNHCLSEVVTEAKKNYGIEKFFVWHAVMGYWGGVDVESERMQQYRPALSEAIHTDEIKEVNPTRWNSEKFPFGMIDCEKAFDFYNDYHTYLKNEGVDGVKIDVQSGIEGHTNHRGGRCRVTRQIRDGLEASVCRNFDGEMINCMSCSNDIIYHLKSTNMIRTSNDFSPNRPESHSNHIYTNAICSIWLSQFAYCDWDMFQTGHEFGAYHAAARAISGGPVYVSDRVGEHDYALIDMLTDKDGCILKAEGTARPTMDCLFADPNKDKSLFKIYNHNKYNSVVGVFAFDEQEEKRGTVKAGDAEEIPTDSGAQYAAYSQKENRTYYLESETEGIAVALRPRQFDLITLAKVEDGFAVIGLTNKLNSGGAVKKITKLRDRYILKVSDGGELLIYSKDAVRVFFGTEECGIEDENGFKRILLPDAGVVEIVKL